MEQVTAQIIVLSFKEEFLIVMFKIKKSDNKMMVINLAKPLIVL